MPHRSEPPKSPRVAGRRPPPGQHRTVSTSRSISQWLARPPGPTAQGGRPATQIGIRFEQPIEVAFELTTTEDSRIQAVHTSSTHGTSHDEAVSLERSKRLLNAREIHLEDPCQFARVALDEQLEPEKHARPSLTSEWAGRDLDRHWRSYDHYWGS